MQSTKMVVRGKGVVSAGLWIDGITDGSVAE